MRYWLAVLGFVFSASTGLAQEAGPNLADRKWVSTDQSIAMVRGHSPRSDGIWAEYENLGTALRANLIVSDVITPDTAWTLWNGKPVAPHNIDAEQTPENYHSTHNHYQNLPDVASLARLWAARACV